MTALADTIELARRREQAAAWDKNEAAVAAQLLMRAEIPAPPELDEETRKDLQPFVAWTTHVANVRYCPCKPWVVASFVIHQSATGTSTAQLLQQLDAIARLHDRHNLANPCATWAARTALESVIQTDPPRSWTKSEQQAFVQLPIEVRATIARREHDRERALRRAQNELAQLRQSSGADKKTAEAINGKEMKMPTKEGPYSKIDKDSTPRPAPRVGFGTGNPRDISRIVDRATEGESGNNGFPAPLPNRD